MRRWAWVLLAVVFVVRWTDWTWDSGQKKLVKQTKIEFFVSYEAADAFARVMKVMGFDDVETEVKS